MRGSLSRWANLRGTGDLWRRWCQGEERGPGQICRALRGPLFGPRLRGRSLPEPLLLPHARAAVVRQTRSVNPFGMILVSDLLKAALVTAAREGCRGRPPAPITRRERVAVADRLAATGDSEFARPSGNTLASTSAAFDGEGDQLSATDAAGNSTAFTYDPAGLVTGEVQPVTSSSGITTSFGYDAAGNQTLYTDGNGSPWQYTYNSWGLRESRIEPATAQYSGAANSVFTTAYDADQNPVTESEPGGVTVTDTYNKLDELTGQSGSDADAATPARTFGYDTNGNLTSATTSNTAGSGSNATSETFTYNDRGEVLTASGSGGPATYGYNGDGQAASVADAAGTTSYTYDNAGRLATLASPATGTTATYSYNLDSQVSGISYGPGNDSQSFGYDSQRRLASDTLKTSTGTVVASAGYGYNADGQVASETTRGLAGPASSTYTYDEAGRLTSWLNGTATTQYSYDGNGNLTRDGAKTYTYDARDELTSDGTSSYTYTARGTAASESSPSGSIAVSFDAYGDQAGAGPGRTPTTPSDASPPTPPPREEAGTSSPTRARPARSPPTARRRTRGTPRAACWPAWVPPAAGRAAPWR